MAATSKKSPSQFDGLKNLGTGKAVVEAETTKKVGRPLKQNAKSRDEDYRSWGGYLKIETVNDANYELGKLRDGRDLSDLLEELLAGWVDQQRARAK